MQILVADEKHGRRYLAANTNEQLARSALKLLKERMEYGYYYDPSANDSEWARNRRAKEDEVLRMTDEQIAALPSHMRLQVEQERQHALRARREREADEIEFAELKRIIDENDTSVTVETGRVSARGTKLRDLVRIPAWDALQRRSDGEYEGVELETVEEA